MLSLSKLEGSAGGAAFSPCLGASSGPIRAAPDATPEASRAARRMA